jgi:hypothetical protein
MPDNGLKNNYMCNVHHKTNNGVKHTSKSASKHKRCKYTTHQTVVQITNTAGSLYTKKKG